MKPAPHVSVEVDLAQPYADSLAHLLAELERVDLLIRARIAYLRRLQADDEHFRGLYISEQEVDDLLERPLGTPQWLDASSAAQRPEEVERALAALDERLAARRRLSLERGTELRLDRLARLFGLDVIELDAVLVCLAVEIDLRYEKLYAYLQDDVTRKRPSIDLLLQLLVAAPAERLVARRRFHADAPLLARRIVTVDTEAGQAQGPLLARFMKLEDRIVQYLLGHDALDERLRTFVSVLAPARGLDDLLLEDAVRAGLRRAWPERPAALLPRPEPLPVMLLGGQPGAGKRSIAAAICSERGWPLLVVELAAWPVDAEPARLAELVEREAALRGAAVFWAAAASSGPFDAGAAAEGRGGDAAVRPASVLGPVLRAIDAGSAPCFWAGDENEAMRVALSQRGAIVMPMPPSTVAQRQALWASCLGGVALAGDVDIVLLASRFKLSLGRVVQAAATARRLAQLRGGATAPIDAHDLLDACRLHSNQKLTLLARKVGAHYQWSDIVLPADRLAQLREICNHVKYRDRVYGDWGFGGKLALGKGLAVLFAGPSGTGKTMSASIIASELGLDLYKIDLSTVISKYIGETEKNLSKIFDEAETSNAILFFDEADALFGKRSEVRDSHDRYANIEVGYLLQRMEEYEGIAILATNFRKNMDDAFTRRLHFTVEFPFPNDEDRHRIWQGIWPQDTPRDSALDLRLLAERFEMTGGNIKNVAVAAAFLAADDDQVVRMGHVIEATQREYQKTGKLIGDFAGAFAEFANGPNDANGR